MRNMKYPFYNVDEVLTLKDLLTLCRGKYAEKTAFMFADRKGTVTEISYSTFVNDVASCGSRLISDGYAGKHIAVYGDNSYEWIVAYFAVVCTGNAVVPVDKNMPAGDCAALISDADCGLLLFDESYRDEAEEMRLDSVKKISLAQVKKAGNAPERFWETKISPDTLAAIVYTSGTTGKSKGVMLTHGNLAADAVNSSKSLFVPEGTILLLPLHHTFGMMAGVLCQLLKGYYVFINQSLRFLKRDIELAKPAHLSVVPLIMKVLLDNIWSNARAGGKDKLLKKMLKFSSFLLSAGIDARKVLFKSVINGFGGRLEMLISGGAAIDKALVEGLEAFGIKIINGYGITECSPIFATTRNRHSNFPSVGSVVPCCEAKIDESSGEILVRGDTVFVGYYKNEEATAAAFDGEWFRTGDLGRIDENGFLYITGRLKNLIILSNGENISPEELESSLACIEGIKEVLVYAENELIVAEIFPDYEIDGCESKIEAEITQLNKTLPAYKQIAKTKFRQTEFEKTTTKKIKRSAQQCETVKKQ